MERKEDTVISSTDFLPKFIDDEDGADVFYQDSMLNWTMPTTSFPQQPNPSKFTSFNSMANHVFPLRENDVVEFAHRFHMSVDYVRQHVLTTRSLSCFPQLHLLQLLQFLQYKYLSTPPPMMATMDGKYAVEVLVQQLLAFVTSEVYVDSRDTVSCFCPSCQEEYMIAKSHLNSTAGNFFVCTNLTCQTYFAVHYPFSSTTTAVSAGQPPPPAAPVSPLNLTFTPTLTCPPPLPVPAAEPSMTLPITTSCAKSTTDVTVEQRNWRFQYVGNVSQTLIESNRKSSVDYVDYLLQSPVSPQETELLKKLKVCSTELFPMITTKMVLLIVRQYQALLRKNIDDIGYNNIISQIMLQYAQYGKVDNAINEDQSNCSSTPLHNLDSTCGVLFSVANNLMHLHSYIEGKHTLILLEKQPHDNIDEILQHLFNQSILLNPVCGCAYIQELIQKYMQLHDSKLDFYFQRSTFLIMKSENQNVDQIMKSSNLETSVLKIIFYLLHLEYTLLSYTMDCGRFYMKKVVLILLQGYDLDIQSILSSHNVSLNVSTIKNNQKYKKSKCNPSSFKESLGAINFKVLGSEISKLESLISHIQENSEIPHSLYDGYLATAYQFS